MPVGLEIISRGLSCISEVLLWNREARESEKHNGFRTGRERKRERARSIERETAGHPKRSKLPGGVRGSN